MTSRQHLQTYAGANSGPPGKETDWAWSNHTGGGSGGGDTNLHCQTKTPPPLLIVI